MKNLYQNRQKTKLWKGRKKQKANEFTILK